MNRRTLVALLAGAALTTACGGAGGASRGGGTSATGARAQAAVRPALATAPRRPGEIVVHGDVSPRSHGPFTLRGRYTVRFEQIAPEDPELDFSTQTAFVAVLDRHARREGSHGIRLFRTAARTGRTEVTARGRWWVDVSFGDFPYAVRLTPVARR